MSLSGFNLCFNQPIFVKLLQATVHHVSDDSGESGSEDGVTRIEVCLKMRYTLQIWWFLEEHNTGTIANKPSTFEGCLFSDEPISWPCSFEKMMIIRFFGCFVFDVFWCFRVSSSHPIHGPWSSATTRTSRIERHRAEGKRSENGIDRWVIFIGHHISKYMIVGWCLIRAFTLRFIYKWTFEYIGKTRQIFPDPNCVDFGSAILAAKTSFRTWVKVMWKEWVVVNSMVGICHIAPFPMTWKMSDQRFRRFCETAGAETESNISTEL